MNLKKAVLNQATYNRIKAENKLDNDIFYCIDNSYPDGKLELFSIDIPKEHVARCTSTKVEAKNDRN